MAFALKYCGRLLTIILVLAGLPNAAQAQSGNDISDLTLTQFNCNGLVSVWHWLTFDATAYLNLTYKIQGTTIREIGLRPGSPGIISVSYGDIVNFPPNTLITVDIWLGTSPGLGDLDKASITFNCTTGEIIHKSSGSSRTSASGPPCMALLDGRINSVPDKDCAAPIAIYGSPLQVYVIDPASGDGHLALSLSDAEIEAVGVPQENTLLAEAINPFTGQPVRLYRLDTGEFQLNTWAEDGSAYVFVWDDAGSKYRLPG